MAFQSDRKDSSELPAVLEIEALLEQEAKRQIPQSKENAHYADFTLLAEWLKALELSTEDIIGDLPWQDLVARNVDLPEKVATETIRRIEGGDAHLEAIVRQVTAYLGEEDEPQVADEIFVFGNKNLKRIEKAVELYEQGIAPRIFVSGGMPIYEKREESEAEIYKRWALEHGVPLKAIFTHETAISIADNVRGGLNRMDELGLPYGSMVLISAWFAMRRSWAMMMKQVPEETKLYRVNAAFTPGGDYDPELWWKSSNGIKVIFNEFAKLRYSEALNSS